MKLRKMTAGIHGVSEVLNDCDGNPIDLYVQAFVAGLVDLSYCHSCSHPLFTEAKQAGEDHSGREAPEKRDDQS